MAKRRSIIEYVSYPTDCTNDDMRLYIVEYNSSTEEADIND